MRVLVATHSYSGNGAAVMLLAVLEYWVKHLHWDVDVLLDMNTEVPDDLAQTGANVFPTADPKNYDFAIVNTVISAHYVDMLAPKVKTVLWVHEGDTVLMGSPAPPGKWRHLFGLPWKVVFQSPWQPDVVFRSFLTGSMPGQFVCVRNGLPSIPQGLVPNAKKLGKQRIVFVGGVYGRKRPNDLVDAILGLKRDDVECVFVGTTANIETIGADAIDKIKSRPDLFLLPGELNRKGTLEYLAGADLFCLPSGDESQPIAPLEAAALNVPCVLSDLPPYKGIWRHGVNCLLFPVGDTALLRWNLNVLLEDAEIRGRIVHNARSLVDYFSMESFVHRFTAEMPI